MSYQPHEHAFKYVIVGDTGVGKSLLLGRFTETEDEPFQFEENNNKTIGVEFGAKTVHLNGKGVKILAWDTSGQERFRNVRRSYYRGVVVALVCFDVTNRESFEHLQSWLEDARRYAGEGCIIQLVGLKSDLDSQREVPQSEIDRFLQAQQQQGYNVTYTEASAKTGDGVREAFVEPAKAVFANAEKIDVSEVQEGAASPQGAAGAAGMQRFDFRALKFTLGRFMGFVGAGIALGLTASVLGVFAFTAGALVGAGALAGLAAWGAYEVVNCGYKGCTGSEMGLCHSAWNGLPSPLACCSPSKDGELELELVEHKSHDNGPQN